MRDPLNVLVVRFGSLGDVILTTPLLRAIHRAHPTAAIVVVTKARWAPVLRHNPSITRVEALADDEPLRALVRRLRSTPWSHRLDLHDSLRSRAVRLLLGGRWRRWRPPRIRRAFVLWTGIDGLIPPTPVAERYFVAASDLGVIPDGDAPEVYWSPADDATAESLVPHGPFAAIVPGAGHATKRWPPPHWAALSSRLRRRGLAVVAVGAEEERAMVPSADVLDLCGVGLGVTAAVLRRAAVAVAGDTGLLHLATATRTPVVAVFGPTTPAFGYAPYQARARVVERSLPCRPCSVYGGAHCPMRHHRCMIDVAPNLVVQAVEALAS